MALKKQLHIVAYHLITIVTIVTCSDNCKAPIRGYIGRNLLQTLNYAQSEYDCENACFENEKCKFFTYNRLNSTVNPG